MLVRGSRLTARFRNRHRGKTDCQVGFFADGGKYFGFGVFRDVVRHGKSAEGTRTLGMHAALGDHFAGKMRQLLEVPDVLQ
jgi:hypothetical protein